MNDYTKTEVYAEWLEQLTPEHICNKALKRVAVRLRNLEARQVCLPKITEEIYEQFGYTCLIEMAKWTEGGKRDWTQDAVDFACLLNSKMDRGE